MFEFAKNIPSAAWGEIYIYLISVIWYIIIIAQEKENLKL